MAHNCAPFITGCDTGDEVVEEVRSADHDASHEVLSTLMLPRPSYAQILSSTPCYQTPSAYVPPSMSATKFHTHTE
jgi:hypothetical protein